MLVVRLVSQLVVYKVIKYKCLLDGCVLSPMLFNIYSEFVFREALEEKLAGAAINSSLNNIRVRILETREGNYQEKDL